MDKQQLENELDMNFQKGANQQSYLEQILTTKRDTL